MTQKKTGHALTSIKTGVGPVQSLNQTLLLISSDFAKKAGVKPIQFCVTGCNYIKPNTEVLIIGNI